MTTDKLIKLQRLMTHANNLAPTGYKEIPIFTINTTMRYAHLGNSDIYDLPKLLE